MSANRFQKAFFLCAFGQMESFCLATGWPLFEPAQKLFKCSVCACTAEAIVHIKLTVLSNFFLVFF
jgi:hypothetical protein